MHTKTHMDTHTHTHMHTHMHTCIHIHTCICTHTHMHTHKHTHTHARTHSHTNTHYITWFSGQYGEILHECVQVFSRAVGEGKCCTRVQCLAILPTKPGNEVFIMYYLLAMLATPTVTNFYVHYPAQNYLPGYNELQKS